MTSSSRQDSGSGKVFPSGNMPIPGINDNFQLGRKIKAKTLPARTDDSGGVQYNPELQMPPGANGQGQV